MKKLSDIFKYKLYPFFAFLLLVAVVVFWKSTAPVESAQQKDEIPQIEDYDIRTDKTKATQKLLRALSKESGADSAAISGAKSNLDSAIEDARNAKRWKLKFNEISRTPEIISGETANESKTLTSPNQGQRAENLRRFIGENSALLR